MIETPLVRFRLFLSLLAAFSLPAAPAPASPLEEGRYQEGPASPDGTGRLYMGREIASVMGFPGAAWLERSTREAEERPRLLLEALALGPGQVVADIGAGTGYYTRPMASAVAPNGTVFAVDIQPEMLQLLRRSLEAEGIGNVVTRLGSEKDPRLPPGSLDLALMVDVYHEFSHPYEMLQALCRALKPGGRLVFVEYRAEDPAVPIRRLHKMTEDQVRREASVHPLRWVGTVNSLPWQHIVIFERDSRGSGGSGGGFEPPPDALRPARRLPPRVSPRVAAGRPDPEGTPDPGPGETAAESDSPRSPSL